MMYESYEIGCVDYCVVISVHIVLRRKGPVWHGRRAKTVLYIILGGRDPYDTGGVRRRCYIYIILEEGTRMARAECEDGAICIFLHLYK